MKLPKGYIKLQKSVLYDGDGDYCIVPLEEFNILMKHVEEMAKDLNLFQDMAKVVESPALKNFKRWK